MTVIYFLWRGLLIVLAFLGWGIGMIVGTFIGGLRGGFMRGYTG